MRLNARPAPIGSVPPLVANLAVVPTSGYPRYESMTATGATSATPGVGLQLEQGLGRQQIQGRRLQVDRGQHQLRPAAHRADDEIEPIGGAGAREPQRALLRAQCDAQRDGHGDQRDHRRAAQRIAAQLGGDQRQRIHAADRRRCGTSAAASHPQIAIDEVVGRIEAARERRIVRRHDERRVDAAAHGAQQVRDDVRGVAIETRGGLVGQHDRRLAQQCPSHRHALLLAARKSATSPSGRTPTRSSSFNARPHRRIDRPAIEAQGQQHILERRQPGKQVELLEHESDRFAPPTSATRSESAVTSISPHRTTPRRGHSSPARIWSSVVLPDPDGPQIGHLGASIDMEMMHVENVPRSSAALSERGAHATRVEGETEYVRKAISGARGRTTCIAWQFLEE